MTLSPFLSVLKTSPVKWTLIGLAIAFVGFPLISAVIPYVFPEAKAPSGSYLDVVDMKEISLLSVQRLNFSKVCTVRYGTDSTTKVMNRLLHPWAGFDPSETNKLENAKVYVRRIMRGHVTTSLDFSKINTNRVNGKLVIEFPKLVAEPFIDEWIFYDSKGTGDVNTKEMTRAMDSDFRDAMLKTALQSERVERAKQQAERIVDMLYPGLEFEPRWPEDSKSGESAPVDAETKSETTGTSHE